MKGYSSRDVARLLRLTVAQVRGFARDGFLTPAPGRGARRKRSEEHTSELQSRSDLVCRLLLEKKKIYQRGATDSGRSTPRVPHPYTSRPPAAAWSMYP